MTETKRFRKNDEGFVCDHCGKKVPPNGVTSRDHCPHCLYSRHVDLYPGDRRNPCGGALVPLSALPHPKKGFVIRYKCAKCGETVMNKAALSGAEPDDMDLLIRLTCNTTEDH